ncbi:hypothetical protein OV203_26115 [Nannocystis sp. ILAH1]|uniref:hypothetical protein n=1 Tax=Nannocystis sp. ILAH1 TaxID=2996789 RepID=UPI0022717276|nr:hypothetical protein [Nannocystis sp. ILAH1]MCY0990646.1 hypothetical protein [Nannocystis sp. ILAH1]
MARRMPLEDSPVILVVGARPRKGRLEGLECYMLSRQKNDVDYYQRKLWMSIEDVKKKMTEGQKFQVARLSDEGWFEKGAFLELVVQSEANHQGWDNLTELQKRYREE